MTLTDVVGLIKQTPTFASQEATDTYKLVVGINIGPDRASCSFAYKHDPFKIYDIKNWNTEETDELVPSMVKDEDFPSIVKYTESEDSFLIGSKVLTQHTMSEELNVYDVIVDHLSGQNNLLSRFQQLNAEKVLCNFIEKLLADASEIFGKIAEEEEASFLAVYKRQPHAIVTEEAISKIKEKFKFSLDRCRYCISGPQDQDYQKFMRKVFTMAGILGKGKPQDRLMFVSDAEALGYYTISTNGFEDQYKYRYKYIICDVNYNYANFAEISIDATQTTSSVIPYDVSNVPEIQGWNPLEKIYRNYLLQSNPESESIEQEIQMFRQEIISSKFSFDGDKRELVMVPFTDALLSALSSSYGADERIKRICYFGNVISHYELNEYMEFQKGDKETELVEIPNNALSKGAVTRALRVTNAQLPSSADSIEEDINIAYSLEDKPVDSKEYDYIIGMDFGTTYSGCSFASTHANKTIHPIRAWPGNDGEAKTPTLLLYNNITKTLEKNWGNLAKSHGKQDTALLESFKLLISPKVIRDYYGPGNHTYDKIRKENSIKGLLVKDMIVSYVSKLNEAAIKHIKDKEGFMSKIKRRKPKVKYILTVPCMWSETAKATMLEVAVLAKLATREEDITIITEPEAAALCFDEIIRELGKTTAYFIVCDAGGGTVDLVTYATVVENDQASIRQVGEGCGGLCGSNRINHSFKQLLSDCFPGDFVKKAEFLEYIAELFEETKRTFKGDEEFVKIKYPMKFKSKEKILKDNCKKIEGCRIEGGHFVIPGSTLKKLFDVYVIETIELLEKEYAKNKNVIKNVLLVGGFSQSTYLRGKVQQWCDQRELELAPPNARLEASVSYGAVSYGLNPRLVTKRNATQTFALLLDQGNIKTFDYFIKRGAIISTTHKYTKRIELDAAESAVVAIYSSSEETNIERNFDDSYTKVLEVRLDEHCTQNTPRTAEIALEFNATGVHCLVVYDKNDFVYNSAEVGNNVAYKLRYRGVRDDRNAMEVLEKFKKYAPFSSNE